MSHITKDYHSYLLRPWRVRDDGHHWRASLEDVRSGELHGFEDLAALQRFLEELPCLPKEGEVVLHLMSNQER